MHFKISSDKFQLFLYFIVLSLSGSFLLQIPAAYVSRNAVPYIDSLFTAVSATCVTGLSTVDMSVYTKLGFIIIMFLIEMGGLGIITFISMYLALPSKKVSLINRRVVRDFFIDEVETNPKKILFNIIVFTGVIQLAGVICLFFSLLKYNINSPLFTSIFLSVSAFCNAGFSPYNDSLVQFRGSYTVNIIVMLLIILGGLGFIVLKNILQFFSRTQKRLTLHTKVVLFVTAFLVFGGALCIFLNDSNYGLNNLSFSERIVASFFQSVTTRTAGFETLPQADFSPVTKIMSIIFMFIGGSPGSVAGGIKTTTIFIVILYALKGNIRGKGLPVWNRRIESTTMDKAIGILCKSLLIVLLSIICLAYTERELVITGKFDISDLVFEVVSAFGTVGLTQGVTSFLSEPGKIIIILTMFIGRTSLFAMALKMPSIEKDRFVEYPDENVMVG